MIILVVLLFFASLVAFGAFSAHSDDEPNPKHGEEGHHHTAGDEIPNPKHGEPGHIHREGEEEEEGEGKIFVGDDEQEIAAQVRFNKQCWLLDKLIPLVTFRATGGDVNRTGFKWLSVITGEPMRVTNELVSKKNIQPLLDLTEYQHALLSPKIRIYIIKQYGDDAPIEIELPFASELSDKNVEGIFQNRGFGGDGAGIKSFSYELAGINPAEADRLVKARLKLFFQSISDLFEPRADIPGKKEKISFLDLIDYGAKSKKREGGKGRAIPKKPKDFRIKVVVGWSEPQIHEKHRDLLPKDLGKLLAQAKTVISLQLTNHEINFKQDGTFELEIEYQGALEGQLESSNMDIFWLPEDRELEKIKEDISKAKANIGEINRRRADLNAIKAKLAARGYPPDCESTFDPGPLDVYKHEQNTRCWRERLKQIEKIMQEEGGAEWMNEYPDIADAVRRGNEGSARHGGPASNKHAVTDIEFRLENQRKEEKEEKATNEEIKDLKESAKKLKSQRKNVIYSRILTRLTGDPTRAEETRTKNTDSKGNLPGDYEGVRGDGSGDSLVYEIFAPKEEVGVFGAETGTTDFTIETRERIQRGKDTYWLGTSPPRRIDYYGTKLRRATKRAQRPPKGGWFSDDESARDVYEDADVETDVDNQNLSDVNSARSNNHNIPIYYFYFGDLIDVVVEIIRGGVQFSADGPVQINKEAVAELKKTTILMGPLVIEDKNRKKKARPGEPGQKFIISIADIPIEMDLFQRWYLKNVLKPQKERYLLKDFLFHVVRDLITPALGRGCFNDQKQQVKMGHLPLTTQGAADGYTRLPKYGSRCTISQIKKALPLQPDRGSANIAKLENYLYFFGREIDPSNRPIDIEADNKRGIYHFYIGRESGLLKKVTFQKADIKGLKEARITNDAETEDGFLREKYDATVDMVGNALFFPGQYIYIHPTVQSGASRRQLQLIGLGGYYLVTSVNHLISADYYQTTLKTRWESYGLTKKEVDRGDYDKPIQWKADEVSCINQDPGAATPTRLYGNDTRSTERATPTNPATDKPGLGGDWTIGGPRSVQDGIPWKAIKKT